MQTLLLFFFRERFLPRSNQLRVFREVLLFRCWHAKQKSQNDHFFFIYMYRVLPYIWFCREVFGFTVTFLVLSWGILFLSWGFCCCREIFGFAVRFLFLPWGFRFCREVFCFCREVFGFAVRYFVFAVRFLVLPWCFCFCREVFGFDSCGPP